MVSGGRGTESANEQRCAARRHSHDLPADPRLGPRARTALVCDPSDHPDEQHACSGCIKPLPGCYDLPLNTLSMITSFVFQTRAIVIASGNNKKGTSSRTLLRSRIWRAM